MKKERSSRNLLVSLLAFLSVGALFGGAVFIISPSGKLFGMPLSMLAKSPFHNFLIPGIILFIILGIVPMLTVVGLIKRPNNKFMDTCNFFRDMHWSWTSSIYIAFALIIWIQVEVYFLQAVNWAHLFYTAVGLVIILVALLPHVRNLYKKA